MAENNTDKEALKAAKEAEKAAKLAKKERIKKSKPKKDGTVFSRAGHSMSKFFKDFGGTIKKIIWPTGAQVMKNSAVVLATIIVIGLVVFGIDQALTAVFGLGTDLAISAAEQLSPDESTTAEGDTTAASGETTSASEENTSDAQTTSAETTVESTTAAN